MQRVLFYRDFRRFTGGHLKVWHYFNHVRSSPTHTAHVAFTRESVWDESNPWGDARDALVEQPARFDPDVLFLAGLDWHRIRPSARRRPVTPVINLVQHVRHAEPDDPRYRFLHHRAVRICVSGEVASAIEATGRVNGPVFTIPNGLDLDELPAPSSLAARDIDLLVVATKRPEQGAEMLPRLERIGRRVRLLGDPVPRRELLMWMNRARVTLFLPRHTEGFYLPALEGMALGTVVVCPDCVGNRSYCLPGINALRPAYTDADVLDQVEAAVALPPDEAERLVAAGSATAEEHRLGVERVRFLEVLNDLPRLWGHPSRSS
jgi:glycosyltransferase involved in cell wall biosynthesis